jgi:hypothetical protein
MDAEGIGYLRRDNCFVQVADIPRAQQLLDRQLRISWTSLLNRIANQANPARKTIFGQHALDLDYYWSVEETALSGYFGQSRGELEEAIVESANS